MSATRKLLLVTALISATVGCSKVELYSNLPEREANEMMAILMKQGISCTKLPGEEGTWRLTVGGGDFGRSVEMLKELGYPRESFTDMGQMFQKSGLVSSPTEERIRFMHALSQELAMTISQVDGVLTARVHIVLPNNNPFGEEVQPSSAAVFVKHHHNAMLEDSIPKFKELVIASIEGLEPDTVTVALFSADEPLVTDLEDATRNPPMSQVMTLWVAPESVGRFWAILTIALALAATGIGFGVISWLRLRPSAPATGSA